MAVSRPFPSSLVYFSRAPFATEVSSRPVLAGLSQPEDTLPPPSPLSSWVQSVPETVPPLVGLLLALGRGLGSGALPAQEGGKPPAAPQQHRQQQEDQLHAAPSAPGPPGAAAGALPAAGVPASGTHRPGSQAVPPLVYRLARPGDVPLPAPGPVLICRHTVSLPCPRPRGRKIFPHIIPNGLPKGKGFPKKMDPFLDRSAPLEILLRT